MTSSNIRRLPRPTASREAEGEVVAEIRAETAVLPPELATAMARAEQVIAAREEARVYQLAFWQDDKRAMPSDFIGCALFSAIQEKASRYIDDEIANANGFLIKFKGKRLTQVHADVWQGIMHVARSASEGTKVRFRSREFLRLIGRHTGKSQRDQLHRWITDLVATNVEIVDTTRKRRYFGSLLPEGGRDESSPHDAAYVVTVNRHLCKLFSTGFATVDWEQRRLLSGQWLALWLHNYVSKFRKPVTVAELHRLSGSDTKDLRHFREKLRNALEELEKVGLLSGWRVEKGVDTVFFDFAPKSLATEAASVEVTVPRSERPAVPAPERSRPAARYEVSPAARLRYTQLFGRGDVEACLNAWQTWLEKSGRSAERPDGAFLGFAKKWVVSVAEGAPAARRRASQSQGH